MVSPFTLGTMEFGSKVDESVASQLVDWVVDAGVNVVDTANSTRPAVARRSWAV